ncbi:hypothetical protein CYY_007658 [Polysphondylium violaceum]|uniref:B-block binding subunit of TFIIIC domain-containing protein n=1 Tax=Polysphondylium violaceum TaxID=133409 RepID=A0A8J4PQL1_9MYCE|nr:hypothetical protein CYY_007658 [Polysphondylium violaceum]
MLDDIISNCINEIALNGSAGMKPSDLWARVEGMVINGRPDKPLQLNDALKRRLHTLILENSSIMVLNPLAAKKPIQAPTTPSRKKPAAKAAATPKKTPAKGKGKEDEKKEEEKKQEDKKEEKEQEQKEEEKKEQEKKQEEKKEEEKSIVKHEKADAMEIDNPVKDLANNTTVFSESVVNSKQLSNTQISIRSWYNIKSNEAMDQSKSDDEPIVDKSKFIELSDQYYYLATKEFQYKALGISYDQVESLGEIYKQLLETIGSSREKGVVQRDLSAQFNMDARYIFHPLKHLILKGYIVKEPIYTVRGSVSTSSQRLTLKKFYKPTEFKFNNDEWKERDYPKKAFVYVLNQEKDKSLTMNQIKEKLSFISTTTMKKIKKLLLDNHWIDIVERGKDGKEILVGGRPDSSKTYVVLLRPMDQSFYDFLASKGGEGGEGSDDEKPASKSTTAEEDEEAGDNTFVTSNLVMERPIYEQLYDFIRLAGPKGITQKELYHKIGEYKLKFVSATLPKFIISYRVKVVPESAGKQLVYKVLADPADYLVSDTNQLALPIPSQPLQQMVGYSDNIDNVLTGGSVHKDRPLTVTFINRTKVAYEHIALVKAITTTSLLQYMIGLGDKAMDNKSIHRILKYLEMQGRIHAKKLYCNRSGAHRTIILLYDAKIPDTDPDILAIIEALKEPIYARIKDPKLTTSGTKMISIQYGFLKGIYQRAMYLHKFIQKYVVKSYQDATQDTSSTHPDIPEQSKIIVNRFIRSLSTKEFLQIISQPESIPDLDRHMMDETLIGDLSLEIREKLFAGQRYLKKMGDLVKLLSVVNIIKVDNSLGYSEYIFNRYVQLDNTVYDFSNAQEILNYWENLQFLVLLPEVKEISNEQQRQQQQPATTSHDAEMKETTTGTDQGKEQAQQQQQQEPEANSQLALIPQQPKRRSKKPFTPSGDGEVDFLLEHLPDVQNIHKWGIKESITKELTKLIVHEFNSIERFLTKEDFIDLAIKLQVGKAKVLLLYKKYLKAKEEQEKEDVAKEQHRKSQTSGDEDEETNNEHNILSHILPRRRRRTLVTGSKMKAFQSKKRLTNPDQLLAYQINRDKRKEYKKMLLPYRRLKWTPAEDSILLKEYTNVFQDFFENIPEANRHNTNSPYYITPSGIPSMLNPLWEDLGEKVQKIGQLCYRRMRLLVKKYPSYKNISRSDHTSSDLPLDILEFYQIFNINYAKCLLFDQFEFTRFDDSVKSIQMDKLKLILSIDDREFRYQFGIQILGHDYHNSFLIQDMLNDKIIKLSKLKNTGKSYVIAPNKLFFKNTSLPPSFFNEVQQFLLMIKNPALATEVNNLFSYEPSIRGGSVAALMGLLQRDLIEPVVSLTNFEGVSRPKVREKVEKVEKVSKLGNRLDRFFDGFQLKYQVIGFIDASYCTRLYTKRPYPKNEIDAQYQLNGLYGDDDEQQEGDQEDHLDQESREKKIKLDKAFEEQEQAPTAPVDTTTTTTTTTTPDPLVAAYNQYESQFEEESLKSLLTEKLGALSNAYVGYDSNMNGDYVLAATSYVSMCQHVLKAIKATKEQGATRNFIVAHLLQHGCDTLDTLFPGCDVDHRQLCWENLPKWISDLKFYGIIDTLFTYSDKKYLCKEFVAQHLIPIDLPNTNDRWLPKPWLSAHGNIQRDKFNKMFVDFATCIYFNPGSTLEVFAHKLKIYQISLLKEVAIILQSLNYISITQYQYTPPSLFTDAVYSTMPLDMSLENNMNLILTPNPEFFNLNTDFTIHLTTDDF